jgi:hypothetical protein
MEVPEQAVKRLRIARFEGDPVVNIGLIISQMRLQIAVLA